MRDEFCETCNPVLGVPAVGAAAAGHSRTTRDEADSTKSHVDDCWRCTLTTEDKDPPVEL
jgi:hypothetical protein